MFQQVRWRRGRSEREGDGEEALTAGAAKEVKCLSASLLEQAGHLGLAGPDPQPPCAPGPTERMAEEGPATSGPAPGTGQAGGRAFRGRPALCCSPSRAGQQELNRPPSPSASLSRGDSCWESL